MVKFLVGILCSNDVRLLHETFKSVVNQEQFDDYHIFIIASKKGLTLNCVNP